MPGLLASGFGSIVDVHTVACSPDIRPEAEVGTVVEEPGIVAEAVPGTQMVADVLQVHIGRYTVESAAVTLLTCADIVVRSPIVASVAD